MGEDVLTFAGESIQGLEEKSLNVLQSPLAMRLGQRLEIPLSQVRCSCLLD